MRDEQRHGTSKAATTFVFADCRWSSGLRRRPARERCVNADESDGVDRGTTVAIPDGMLSVALTLLVGTFCVALVRLTQAWKAEHTLATSRALVVAHERLAA